MKQDDFKAAEQGCDAAIEKLEELERKKDESLFNKLKKWISSDLPSWFSITTNNKKTEEEIPFLPLLFF